MSNAISGPGFLLQLGDAAGDGGTFATIAEVKDIDGPKQAMDIIDVTNQSSLAEEIITSLLRPGDVDFDVNFDPQAGTHDGTTGLLYLQNNKIKRGYRLQLQDPGNHYLAFDAYVVNFGVKAPVTGVLTGTVKLRVTGAVTMES